MMILSHSELEKLSEDVLEGRANIQQFTQKHPPQKTHQILEQIFGEGYVLEYPEWDCWRIIVAGRQYVLYGSDYQKARGAAKRSYNPPEVLKNALYRFLKPLRKAEGNGHR